MFSLATSHAKKPNLPQRKTETTVIRPHSQLLSVLLCLVYKSVWFVFFFFLFFSLPSAWSFCISLLRKDWGTGKPSYSSDLYIKTKLRDFCFRKLKRIINSLAHSDRRTVDVVVGQHSVDRVSSPSSSVKWVELLSQRETCYTSSARRCFAMIGMLRAWRKLINPNRFYA